MEFKLEQGGEVDVISERRIVTGLIVSTEFCQKVVPFLELEYFEVEFVREIVKWVIQYWKKYQKAPVNNIQYIFEDKTKRIRPATKALISSFLSDISTQFSLEDSEEDANFNSDYFVDQAKRYIKGRILFVMNREVQHYLDEGKVEQAEQLMIEYQQRKVEIGASEWNKLDRDFVEKVINNKTDGRNIIFQFPGILGKRIGPFERKWLVAYLGPQKRGKCVHKDMEVLLPNGELKTIQKVFQDKDPKIISLDVDGKFVSRSVLKHFDNGVKSIYEVTTRSGRKIKVTNNEPFLTPTGWKNTEELKKGNFIASPKILNFFGTSYMEDHKIRLLAYLIADGGLTKSSVVFTKQCPLMQKDFFDCIKKMGDRVAHIKGSKIGFRICKHKKNKGNAPSKTRMFLHEVGLGFVKSNKKHIPDIIFKLPKDKVKLFLQAIFTCDGWLCDSEIGYSSTSERLIYQIQHLLTRFGIISKVRKVNTNMNTTAYSLVIQDKASMLLFLNEVGFLFQKKKKEKSVREILLKRESNCGFLDVLPPEILLLIKQQIVGRKNRAWYRQLAIRNLERSIRSGRPMNREGGRRLLPILNSPIVSQIINSDIWWDQIKSIRYVGREQTYDLAVAETHNFVVQNFVVHNTFLLWESMLASVMAGKKVVGISLEMSDEHVGDRLFRRMTSLPDEGGLIYYPVFDCLKNQDGSCTMRENRNRVLLKNPELPVHPSLTPQGYQTCTACISINRKSQYVPATWWSGEQREAFSYRKVFSSIEGWNLHYGLSSRFRFKCYPAFTASIADLESDINALEGKEGFVPDVIVIDYADIIFGADDRDGIDKVWKELKRLSQVRNCLVITATQGNRLSIEKKRVRQTNISEDIRKLSHVDVMIGLNQTPFEKKKGLMRMSVIAHRFRDFNEMEDVGVTQKLDLGQPLLDSIDWMEKEEKEEKEEKDGKSKKTKNT